jgi:hypothetical protein
MKIGSAKVPVKPVKGGGSARVESRLCKDLRVTGPVQSARLQEPLRAVDRTPGLGMRGQREEDSGQGLVDQLRKSWHGKVVQISGKAKARADAPLQQWGLNGVASVAIETIGR